MALIAFDDVRRVFAMGSERVGALDGVRFAVEAGESLAIVGPSGCGKSTLMNILGLLDLPDEGAYVLDGRDVRHLTDTERAHLRNQEIGFVFQSFNLLPRMSALRNVEMPLVYSASYDRGYSKAKIREKARAALDRVNLGNRTSHAPNELSGGQRQRVAIARALVNEPKLLLADEPTGNLDSRSGHEILQLFRELNGQGVTLIVVTHDANVAKSAGRVITMLDGKIQTDTGRRDAPR